MTLTDDSNPCKQADSCLVTRTTSTAQFDRAKRLLKASLEVADPVQQLACEHGAGVVEPEVTA